MDNIKDSKNDVTEKTPEQMFEDECSTLLNEFEGIVKARKTIEHQEAAIRKSILGSMEKHGLRIFRNEAVTVKLIDSVEEHIELNTTNLQKSNPALYKELLEMYPRKVCEKKAYLWTKWKSCTEKELPDCREGKVYEDHRGWMYKVMKSQKSQKDKRWRPKYHKPEDIGWKSMSSIPWKDSFEEAQKDLDSIATKEKWKVVDE